MFVWDEWPPPRKNYFLLRVWFINEASGEYTGREVWQKLHRGGGDIHQVGGYEASQYVCDATAAWVQSYAPKGAHPYAPTKHTKRGPKVVVVETDAPPPPKGKARTPSPKPSKVAKVAAQPPAAALDVEALGASVATLVTDACQVSVEQATAMGVEAALAKGRAADHKSALANAEKGPGQHSACPRPGPQPARQGGGGAGDGEGGPVGGRGGEAEGRGGGGRPKGGGGGAAEQRG